MIEVDKPTELMVANLILPLVKDLLLPKIESILSKSKNYKIDANSIDLCFRDYLSTTYIKYSYIDTLTFANKQTLFDTLYEPMTIESSLVEGNIIKYEIDCVPDGFLSKFYRVIIEDTGGMGKSTILIKLLKSIIEEKEGIPLLIPLRKINKSNSILKAVKKQLKLDEFNVSHNTLVSLLKSGRFVFFIRWI